MSTPTEATATSQSLETADLGPRSAVGPTLQPTLAELSVPGRGSHKVPHPPADALVGIPAEHRRRDPLALPELSEPDIVRHFTQLSRLNYSIDGGMYPLGSCTMKYNPKVNEWAARIPASGVCGWRRRTRSRRGRSR